VQYYGWAAKNRATLLPDLKGGHDNEGGALNSRRTQ